MVSLWWSCLLITDSQLCYSSFQHLGFCPAALTPCPQPRRACGVSSPWLWFPQDLCADAHVLSMRQLARLDICQGPCVDPPWTITLPSPGLLCSLFLSSFPQAPLPLVLPPPTPPPASFSLSSLLSPLNILYPSFGQNFRIRSLGPTCCFPWVRNLVLAVWSPGVWSDPLESQNPESQHLCCCTGLCWAYWSVSSLHFHYWFPYSASRLY